MTGIRKRQVKSVIEKHYQSGRIIPVDGIKCFVRDSGNGQVVVCLHGVPTSSFLYRKVLNELAQHGLRGIAFDLPGLGLSDRPADFDYSFSGLYNFCLNVVDVLGLTKFHLVVHDIGGPIGFALAARLNSRIRSITILNTWINVTTFKKPLPMAAFNIPVLGKVALAFLTYNTWSLAFKTLGVQNSTTIPQAEIDAYVDLLKGSDKGKAFLQIMRSFDRSAAYEKLCHQAVQQKAYPVQAIWGVNDPGLTFARYGREIQNVTNLDTIHQLPAKHLLQEEQWKAIAQKIATLAMDSASTLVE